MVLQGKVAVVTGGSRGIGRAICRSLARAGAAVAVGYRQEDAAANALVAEITAAGGRAMAWAADVADPAAAAGLVTAVRAHLGPIDILVNNAGAALQRLLLDTEPAAWDRLLAVNLSGARHCTRQALPDMLARGGGRIINIASIWGQEGAAAEVPYSAAKAALIGYTRDLARRYGRAGVTVNAVAPGAIATDMIADLTDRDRAELAAAIPLGRLGQPEDVAAAVYFLAGPGAGYITGQVLSPNGGWAMR